MKLEIITLIIVLILAGLVVSKSGQRIYGLISETVCEQNVQKLNNAIKMYNLANAPESYFDKFSELNQQVLVNAGFLAHTLDCPAGGLYILENNKVVCTVHYGKK